MEELSCIHLKLGFLFIADGRQEEKAATRIDLN